ncbi:F-box/WD repeat-containing protein 9-like [Puntigrus tetrazona]|uniref:F-box/WD repeat-containing protein 9-like n=1 Tax=Puntigrus tetrazona TaxID=1606681 RepID=UPI001C891F8D|nr:F-box/WD repeat-containing protein 9-like [Puntigrus tetrazona]XP_043090753.1 F-box/WD repeat-containing protein 9-like [Puntigrus tetrazona]XP_043090754.1 F-box/WD repeat-containing protein 9-like [Puntigrus tetrazona]
MSRTSVALEDEEKQQRCPADAGPPDFIPDTPHFLPERLNLEASVSAMETSPSPSSNGTNLLSLPWEIVTQIASHLPAQCVISVLPQVCQTLGKLGEDRLAWQLRAQKLSGPAASFPAGPKEDFDWSKACLEMEQLIGCWTGHENHAETQDEAAVGVNSENLVEMQLDVEVNAAARAGEDDVRVQSQSASDGPHLTESSGTSSPLEHIVLPSGHIADVNCVLLLGGEEALCASGSRDRNVNLWDLREGPRGKLMHTLAGRGTISTHRGWVWCLASSGPLLASGSFDSTVRLWDLEAGGAERGLIQCKAAVLCLSCERDTVLAGSHDQKLSIFDTRAADPLVKSLRLHGDAVLCLASDDQYILSGSKDHTVALFDRRAGKLLQKVQLSSYLLSLSCSGREVWAGDNRGLVHTFSLHGSSLAPVSQFNIHRSLVTGVHYSTGALYTCSSDRTIKVHLPCAPPKTLCTLHHQAGVNGLSVEGGTLAIASGDMNVEVWRPEMLRV